MFLGKNLTANGLPLENRQLLGAVNGIDVLLQCLSVCRLAMPAWSSLAGLM